MHFTQVMTFFRPTLNFVDVLHFFFFMLTVFSLNLIIIFLFFIYLFFVCLRNDYKWSTLLSIKILLILKSALLYQCFNGVLLVTPSQLWHFPEPHAFKSIACPSQILRTQSRARATAM